MKNILCSIMYCKSKKYNIKKKICYTSKTHLQKKKVITKLVLKLYSHVKKVLCMLDIKFNSALSQQYHFVQ